MIRKLISIILMLTMLVFALDVNTAFASRGRSGHSGRGSRSHFRSTSFGHHRHHNKFFHGHKFFVHRKFVHRPVVIFRYGYPYYYPRYYNNYDYDRYDRYDKISYRLLSIADIVDMEARGLSDDVIVTEIARGGLAFDLTTENIVYLRERGVSSRVIDFMLKTHNRSSRAY